MPDLELEEPELDRRMPGVGTVVETSSLEADAPTIEQEGSTMTEGEPPSDYAETRADVARVARNG
jgi:hypothetical protein